MHQKGLIELLWLVYQVLHTNSWVVVISKFTTLAHCYHAINYD